MSCGGLWLAVTITPATQPSSRIANASTGVGSGRGSTQTLNPAPVITSAVSRAKSSLWCRASYPTTTGPCGTLLVQVRRQPGGRPGDHRAVHPVGAGADRAAESRGPELEGAGERVGQVGGVRAALDVGDHLRELRPGDLVRVVGQPRPRTFEQEVGNG